MRATTTTSARRTGRMAVLALTAVAGVALLPAATAATTDAKISNFRFSPDPLTIPVGTTVQWTNDDGVTHTATHVHATDKRRGWRW